MEPWGAEGRTISMMGRMKKIRNVCLHILFLIVLFCVSVLVFARMINQVTPDVAETMPDSTFPLVYMQKDGTNFNCLHGYAREMDVSYLRDSITPLDSDRELDILIQAFSTTIDGVSYEVTSLDGTETLENTKVVKLDKDGDTLSATLALQNKMLMNQEYMLKIRITSGGRNIYYYTHVLLADGLHTKDYLNYVSGFYDKCVNKTDLTTVGAAVEPDETTDEDQTLAYMDIHDSVSQLTWASLNPQIYYKPTPRLTEINPNTATLTLDYRIAAVNDAGVTEVYNVHEYYRVRYTDSRVYLLNFERTTDEIFNPENDVLSDKGILLGITGKDVEYASSSKNRVVAFVQEDELWTCDISGGKLTQVFGFPQKENMDIRDFYQQHQIHILRVEDNGDVWFTVSGYMNRGTHEGENGVAVYFYEAASAMVDEKVFLSSMESTALLAEDADTLSYVSEDGSTFSILLEGTVYQIDLNSRTYETPVKGLAQDCYVASESGRYFAWLAEGEMYDSGTLTVMDLETGSTRDITCGSDERIRPICFMKEDLVYGIARTSEIDVPHGGNGTFAMYKLEIQDAEGNVVKAYEPGDCYVTDVVQTDHTLALTRMVKNGDTYSEASEDHIVNTDTESDVAMGPATQTSDRKQTEVMLRLGSSVSVTNPQVVRSKIITYDTSRTLDIPVNHEKQDLYYVYTSGELTDVCTYINDAIVEADEGVGVVVDWNQNYVWVRGDKDSSVELDLEKLPSAVTSGTMDLEELEQGTGKRAVDLSGCTLDQVLYFVSHGRPVIALTADGPVTIVGYDEYNTYLVDPNGTEWYYAGINDSTEMFENAGNVFVSYLDSDAQ